MLSHYGTHYVLMLDYFTCNSSNNMIKTNKQINNNNKKSIYYFGNYHNLATLEKNCNDFKLISCLFYEFNEYE